MIGFRVGLALGGGAARGVAHIGVIRALEETKIPIDIITGTSAGALVGACYALTRNVDEVQNRVVSFLQSKEFRRTKLDLLRERKKEDQVPKFFDNLKAFLKKGVFYTSSVTRISYISEENFVQGINAILDDILIEKVQIPFAAVAVDLVSGEEVILKKGPLRTAVRASCAIPGVFPPTLIDGKRLVDGSWVDTVPIEPARQLGADFIIGVDISREMDEPGNFQRGLDIIFRTNAIARHSLKELRLKEADLIIRPDIGHLHWSDFSRIDEAIEKGYEATKAISQEIRSMLKRRQIVSIISSVIRKVTPST